MSGPSRERAAGADTGAPRRGGQFQRLQALEDAIKFRRARLAGPCADCASAPDDQCDEHGRDAGLIAEYEQAARQLLAAP